MVWNSINSFPWRDCYFGKLEVNFDLEYIKIIIDADDNVIELKCENCIGINWLGIWDESVIECINIYEPAKQTEESLGIIKENYKEPISNSNGKSVNSDWCELVIKFIDGNKLIIVSSNIIMDILQAENMR